MISATNDLVELFQDAQPLSEHADLGAPFVDIDEERTNPVPHRFIHGGFRDADVRFSFYLPDIEHFDGRFFQYITPVPESEFSSQSLSGEDDRIGFAVSSGAYLIETNGGGPSAADPFSATDPTIGAYRANAASAIFSRRVARQIYGIDRIFGYAFGGSGGAYRTIGGVENTDDVWDGSVPFVVGSPVAIPNCFTPRLLALRVIGDRLDAVADAMDAGGSADPYSDLDDEQRAVLREVTGMGFPLRSWYAHRSMGMHALAVLYPGIRAIDPSYFEDFWAVAGYEGANPASSVHRDRVTLETSVAELLTVGDLVAAGIDVSAIPGASTGNADDAWLGRGTAEIVGARLAAAPDQDPGFAELILDNGPRVVLMQCVAAVVVFGPTDRSVIANLAVGDRVTLDNSGFLAIETYHRHQDPGPQYPVWDQFRTRDGQPLHPQRPVVIGPLFTRGAAGTVPTGRFAGRMILLESLMDREAYPWQADWYRARATEHHGAAIDEHLRVWMTDRALHADTDSQAHPEQSVSYGGVLQQALRDLAAWVERGVEPPASTSYRVDGGQVVVPEAAAERRGVQPTLELTVDGASRVHAAVGARVSLLATAVTPDVGVVTRIEWDLDGDGVFEVVRDVAPTALLIDEQEVEVARGGTWFVTARVSARRDPGLPFARIQNLARLRIVAD